MCSVVAIIHRFCSSSSPSVPVRSRRHFRRAARPQLGRINRKSGNDLPDDGEAEHKLLPDPGHLQHRNSGRRNAAGNDASPQPRHDRKIVGKRRKKSVERR